jgi:hypothetical protein
MQTDESRKLIHILMVNLSGMEGEARRVRQKQVRAPVRRALRFDWLELLVPSGVVSAQKLALCDKNEASGKQCGIEGQPEQASVWENASQCKELTAIFVTNRCDPFLHFSSTF